jgi:hypothetical protein
LFLKSVLLDNSVPASWVNALVSASPSKEKPRAVRRTSRQPAEGRGEDGIPQSEGHAARSTPVG